MSSFSECTDDWRIPYSDRAMNMLTAGEDVCLGGFRSQITNPRVVELFSAVEYIDCLEALVKVRWLCTGGW